MPPKKPWEDERYQKRAATKPAGPLVPNRTISTPTQRLSVASVFFLSQGLKSASSKTLVHFVGYTASDVALIAYLPVLGIPRLNFKRSVVNFQIFIILCLNYSSFIDSRWLVSISWALTRPIAWASGIVPTQNAPSTGYIKGKYIVDVLPEASAKIDTISPLCVDPLGKQPVYLRLTVDNAWPSYVGLSRAQLGNTSDYEQISYVKKELDKFPYEKDRNVYLPVTKPGAYYLNRITDNKTGLRVRVERQRIVIPPCPSVKSVSLSDAAICERDQLKAEIVATGVAPSKLMVDGNWLTLGERSEEDAVTEVRHVVEKVGVFESVSITAGSVSDILGTQSVNQVDTQVSARVLASPKVQFVGNPRLPLIENNVTVNIAITGSVENEPFNITLEKPDGTLSSFVRRKSGNHPISLTQIGKYKLKHISGAKCEGNAQGVVEVFEPPQSSVENKFETIQDKCAGPTGVKAHLKFAGTSPFQVTYRTLKGRRIINEKTETFRERTGLIEFRPANVGEYTYEITEVKDTYRKIQPNSLTTQKIAELPGARFGELSSTKLCGSTKLTAEVIISGRGPFTLSYSIDDKETHAITTDKTTDSEKISLDLNSKAGSHFIRLNSLTDRNGCVTKLGGIRTPSIDVIPEIAHIALAKPGKFKSAEPVDFNIPLSASHLQYPATVVYEHEQDGKKSRYQKTLKTQEDTIHATKPGLWRLVSLDDGRCGGTVEPNQEVEISLYERPEIMVEDMTTEENGLCSNSKGHIIRAKLRGEAPITVIHEVSDPKKQSHVKTHKINNDKAVFEVNTTIPGEYKHFFWILDIRYPEFNRSHVVERRHRVWDAADISFIDHKRSSKICENSKAPGLIPLSVRGAYPSLLDVQADSSQIKQYVIEKSSSPKLKVDFDLGLKPGQNKVKSLNVRDANGCARPLSAPLNEAYVQVLAAPKEPQLQKSDYCVGEKLRVSLKGHGPQFHMEYLWANKRRSASVNGHHFDQYVNTPGNFTVLSVKDEQGCSSKTNVSAQVHELPSSTITEEPHFSIYQGDKISLGFAFKGTAPYSFVYTRSVDGKVKETKTVKNVMEDTYTIIVDEGGEYEIIELQDKYCRSHR